jgi:hypothetical protein
MDVVARRTARHGKLPVRDLRAVQKRQILVGQTEALLREDVFAGATAA